MRTQCYAIQAALAVLLATAPALAQEDQLGSRGFEADKVYDVGDIDTVNLFNGNLTIALPLGLTYPVNGKLAYGHTVVYNSLIWEVSERFYEPTGEVFTSPAYSRLWNAGAGWMVTPGRLFPPNDPPENPLDPEAGSRWMFVDSSGTKHWLSSELSPGVADGSSLYTTDSTYLRMRVVGAAREIDFPDGRILKFEDIDPGAGQDWRVTERRDVFGNSLDIAYLTTIDDGAIPTGELWQVLTDPHGRTQRLKFELDPGEGGVRLYEADLEAFDAAGSDPRAVFTFSYQTGQADLCYRNNDPEVDPLTSVTVSFLTSITLPDGTTYEMKEGTVPGYANDCTSDGLSGAIQTLRLRTLGELEWDYGTYFLPRDGSGPMGGPNYSGSSGVVERRELDEEQTVLGTWKYGQAAQIDFDPNIGLIDAESQTFVAYPTGDCTKHYFRALPFDRREMGLPFSSMEGADGDGFFVSTEVWSEHTEDPGAIGAEEPEVFCSGEKVRSRRVIYEDDGAGTLNTSDVNRRLKASRTVYHDDGDLRADTTLSDFDGLGHYRTETTAGTFTAGNVRTSTTDYQLFVPEVSPTVPIPAASSNWVLETFARREVAEGADTAVETFCFDTEGFLTRRRTFEATGGSPSEGVDDLIVEYTRDGLGNRTDEEYYGGDLQAAGIGSDLWALSPLASGAEQYHIDHRYQSGALDRTRYLEANGTTVTLRPADHVIDPSTGLVASTRDPANITTDFTYDALGRLLTEKPEAAQGAQTVYTYTNASGSIPAKVTIQKKSNDGTETLATSLVEFDALGRVAAEERTIPGAGGTSRRETHYNGRGWREKISEEELSGAVIHFTELEGYDPFGRPGRIVSPDGHEVLLAYQGVSQITRIVQIGGAGGLSPATTVEQYDRQGRLSAVTEPSGEWGAAITTSYSYDEGNRLKTVSTTATVAGSLVPQTRTFDYDGRGLLTSETHPEKTSPVSYADYDARGHAGAKTDGASDLEFTYDRAERLTHVHDTSGAIWKEFTYADANAGSNKKKGRLEKATRHNRLQPAFNLDVVITEQYEYEGPGGRVSKRRTHRCDDSLVPCVDDDWFETSFSWTDLGNLAGVTYTSCLLTGCDSGIPARTVTYGYQEGLLNEVPGYASTIAYHPNGMLARINRPSGVSDVWDPDPSGMRRPGRIQTTGATGGANLDTGSYAFDGAGNVIVMGGDLFSYDAVSRLVTGSAQGGTVTQSQSYDAFGNRLSVSGTLGTRPIRTDSATNRLTGSPERPITYDAAGNVTAWGATQYDWDPFHMMLRLNPNGSASPDGDDEVYVHTADGERLAIVEVTPVVARWYVRGLDGSVLRTFRQDDVANPGTFETYWEKDHVYRDGQLLATESPAATRHAHLDHLGTPRLWTLADGSVSAHHAYLPFGEEAATVADGETHRFTGHERDENPTPSIGCGGAIPDTLAIEATTYTTAVAEKACIEVAAGPDVTVAAGADVTFRAGEQVVLENGFEVEEGGVFAAVLDSELSETDLFDLDYMHARYCSPVLGRFLSVDPISSADPRAPQSWNGYTYAYNSPLKFVDPTGLYVTTCTGGDEQCAADAKAFEQARQELLKSKDAQERAAAVAFGNPGDENGVTVSFGEMRDEEIGDAALFAHYNDQIGDFEFTAVVTIESGLRGTRLLATAGHEGDHIAIGQEFVGLLNAGADPSANPTRYAAEFRAYQLTHRVLSRGNLGFRAPCAGCRLGVGVLGAAAVSRNIDRMLASPKWIYQVTPGAPGPGIVNFR